MCIDSLVHSSVIKLSVFRGIQKTGNVYSYGKGVGLINVLLLACSKRHVGRGRRGRRRAWDGEGFFSYVGVETLKE